MADARSAGAGGAPGRLPDARPAADPAPPSPLPPLPRGRGEGNGPPLLVIAVRYFFRREIESDRELFQGLAFAQLERLGQRQEEGFAALDDDLTQHGQRVEGLLQSVQDVVV